MLKSFTFTVFFVLINVYLSGQDTIKMNLGEHPVIAIIIDGDTTYSAVIEEVQIQPRQKRAAAARDLRQYRRLIYNVKKVYPYAKLAGLKFKEINEHLQTIDNGKDKRAYIKEMEDQIIKQYEEELKELSINQGRILIKLIDRETSYTSYEVVKELRGSFQAAFWQAIARIFGSNLKTEFDPEGEDKALNEIIIMIENGQL
jgi:hypothetical protein